MIWCLYESVGHPRSEHFAVLYYIYIITEAPFKWGSCHKIYKYDEGLCDKVKI